MTDEVFVRAARPEAALVLRYSPSGVAPYWVEVRGNCIGYGTTKNEAWKKARAHIEKWLLFKQRLEAKP